MRHLGKKKQIFRKFSDLWKKIRFLAHFQEKTMMFVFRLEISEAGSQVLKVILCVQILNRQSVTDDDDNQG